MRPQTARRWSFLVTYCGIWGSVFRAISGPGSVCSCPDLACVLSLVIRHSPRSYCPDCEVGVPASAKQKVLPAQRLLPP